MPSLGVYFTDEEMPHVESAAAASDEKKTSPYIAEAVRQRMAREGRLPGSPAADLRKRFEELLASDPDRAAVLVDSAYGQQLDAA